MAFTPPASYDISVTSNSSQNNTEIFFPSQYCTIEGVVKNLITSISILIITPSLDFGVHIHRNG